jgi:hypothetical protein
LRLTQTHKIIAGIVSQYPLIVSLHGHPLRIDHHGSDTAPENHQQVI